MALLEDREQWGRDFGPYPYFSFYRVRGSLTSSQKEKSSMGEETVQVVYGTNDDLHMSSFVGKTVSHVRSQVTDMLTLDPAAVAQVNGVSVSGSHVLKGGDVLEFVKNSGSKGSN